MLLSFGEKPQLMRPGMLLSFGEKPESTTFASIFEYDILLSIVSYAFTNKMMQNKTMQNRIT